MSINTLIANPHIINELLSVFGGGGGGGIVTSVDAPLSLNVGALSLPISGVWSPENNVVKSSSAVDLEWGTDSGGGSSGLSFISYQEAGVTPNTTANTMSIWQSPGINTSQEAGFTIIRISFQISLSPAGQASVIFQINGVQWLSQIYQVNAEPTQIMAVYKVPTSSTPLNSTFNLSMDSVNFVVATGTLINVDYITYIT